MIFSQTIWAKQLLSFKGFLLVPGENRIRVRNGKRSGIFCLLDLYRQSHTLLCFSQIKVPEEELHHIGVADDVLVWLGLNLVASVKTLVGFDADVVVGPI